MFDLTKYILFAQNLRMCAQGSPVIPGRNGHNGLPHRDGLDGAKGEKGVAAPPRPRGIKGQAGKIAAEERNWKQRPWKKANGHDVGLNQVSERQFFIQSLFYWT